MGVREITGQDPHKLALDLVRSTDEALRVQKAARRLNLYLDNGYMALKEQINQIFKKNEVRERIYPFINLALSHSLFRRVVDEIARPVYSTPPTRTVEDTEDDKRYHLLTDELRLDNKMDLCARLVNVNNVVWQLFRVNQRLGMMVDVITPDMGKAIPDPDDPTKDIGLMYCTKFAGKKAWVFWDDTETFAFFNDDGRLVKGKEPTEHNWGFKPWIAIHRRERWGEYYDTTSGNDLESAHLAVSLLMALTLKLHKSQGFRQLYLTGDILGTPKDQTLDEESMVALPEGTTLGSLDLKSDATHYAQTIEQVTDRLASNHGLSRQRMNQNITGSPEETGLLERRAEMIGVFRQAEHDAFPIIRSMSAAHPNPELRMTDQATLTRVDYAEQSHRADMKAWLEIQATMRSMGLANVLDNIRQLNPEARTNEEAREELRKNLEIESEFIESRRALNRAEDANVNEPGQSPQENGAMGPRVRDGEMSRDEAAEMAEGN